MGRELSIDRMNCLAVSKGYWPINYENQVTFEMPETMKSVFNEYS